MALIVVQRGHVPRTTGAVGAPGEQQFAIATAARLAPLLRGMGHTVRVIDADPPASAYRGDLFVSLHYDSSASPSARGASVGHQSAEGRRFATAWKRYYQQAGWTGGFRPDNYTANLAQYYGVRTAVAQGNLAAFIAEAGFHSNPADAALLAAPDGPDRVARAIAAAVAELTGGTPPPEEDTVSWDQKITAVHPTTGTESTTTAGSHLGRLAWRAVDLIHGQRALRAQLAALTEVVHDLAASHGQLTAEQIEAAARRGAETAIPDTTELATALVAELAESDALDHQLDTAAVEQALRAVLGSLDQPA